MEYWVNDNGIESRMSEAEVKAMQDDQAKFPPPVQEKDKEIEELKRQNAEIRKMLEALASGDTGEAEA